MGIILDWTSGYPGAIDDLVTNFPPMVNSVHDVRASHVNELANAIIAVQTVLGDARTYPMADPMTVPSTGDTLVWDGSAWDASGGAALTVTLQDAYDDGNTIAVTSAKGTIAVSNTDGTAMLSLTRPSGTGTVMTLATPAADTNPTINAGTTGAGAAFQATRTSNTDGVVQVTQSGGGGGVKSTSANRAFYAVSDGAAAVLVEHSGGDLEIGGTAITADQSFTLGISGGSSQESLSLQAQDGASTFDGGQINIDGGDSSSVPTGTAGNGGDIVITGGVGGDIVTSGSPGDGGDIIITGGANGLGGDISGIGGSVQIDGGGAVGTTGSVSIGTQASTAGVTIGNGSLDLTFVGGQILGNDGTNSNPTYGFTSDVDMGLYLAASGPAITSGGNQAVRWNVSQQTLVPALTAATPPYSFAGEGDKGIHGATADTVSIATDGADVANFKGTLVGSSGLEEGVKLDVDVTGQTGTAGFYGLRVVVDETGRGASGQGIIFSAENHLSPILQVYNTGQMVTIGGSAATPSQSFALDLTSGFYQSAADVIGITTLGNAIAEFTHLLDTDGDIGLSLTPEVDQSGSDAYDALLINVLETATGSGEKNVQRWAVNSGVIARLTNTGSFLAGLGDVSNPAVGADLDPDTGIYWPTGDQFAIATGGTQAMLITSGQRIRATLLGTEAIPQWSFTSDPDTGVRRPSANVYAIVTGADDVATFQHPSAATGDEVGVDLAVAVDKATSGNYTSLRVDTTEVSAPGTSDRLLALDLASTTRFEVQRLGHVRTTSGGDTKPAYGFTANDDMGFYRNGADSVGISTEGSAITIFKQLLNTSGDIGIHITPEVDQSSTDSYTGWFLDITETAIGTGTLDAMRVEVDSTVVFRMKNNGRLRAVDGSSATPVYSFNSDGDTGAYQATSNQYGIAAGGSPITVFNQLLNADADIGVHITPTVTQDSTMGYDAVLVNATETSVGSGEKNLQRWAVGGATKARITNTGLVTSGNGSAGFPGYTFEGDTNTGMYRAGSDKLGFSSQGELIMALQAVNATTGDEVGIDLTLDVNKATSGNYTGLKLDVTETSAPGTADLLMDLQVGAASKFAVDNTGEVTAQGRMRAVGGGSGNTAFGFAIDTNSGMYRAGADILGHTTGGIPWVSLARDDQTIGAVTSQIATVALTDNTLYWFEALVIGRDQAGTDRAFYRRSLYAYRQGGGATLGTAMGSDAAQETNANWNVAFSVSSNDLRVDVTGDTGQTIDWRCLLRYQSIA
jgi:hypothetical protein